MRLTYELAGASALEKHSRLAAELNVSPGYFRALGARLISGRDFDDSDRASNVPVAIVKQQFASRNWP
jgi:hypothetical protein